MTADRYSGKLRVRSCGFLFKEGKVLLVELKSPITHDWIWMPPGGGVEFGESLEEALEREFSEETGLEIIVKERIHIQQIIEPPIHAIEFYYLVEKVGGDIKLGSDPEILDGEQLLRNIGFFSKEEIHQKKVQPDILKILPKEFFSA